MTETASLQGQGADNWGKNQSTSSVVCNIAHGQAFFRLRLRGGLVWQGKQARGHFLKWRVCTACSAVISGKCDRRGLHCTNQ